MRGDIRVSFRSSDDETEVSSSDDETVISGEFPQEVVDAAALYEDIMIRDVKGYCRLRLNRTEDNSHVFEYDLTTNIYHIHHMELQEVNSIREHWQRYSYISHLYGFLVGEYFNPSCNIFGKSVKCWGLFCADCSPFRESVVIGTVYWDDIS